MTSLCRILHKPRVVSLRSGSKCYFSSSGPDVTHLRHINPLRENRDNIVEELSDKLRQRFPDQYSFLSKNLQFEADAESQNEVGIKMILKIVTFKKFETQRILTLRSTYLCRDSTKILRPPSYICT